MRIVWRVGTAVAVAAAATSFLLAGAVHAEVGVARSVPEDGAVLEKPPAEVRIEYSGPIEPRMSTLTLLDDRGRVVRGTQQASEGDRTLILRLPSLPGGSDYYVKSQAVGRDMGISTHILRFSVRGSEPPGADTAPGAGRARGLARAAFWVNAVVAMVFLAAFGVLFRVLSRRAGR